MVTGIEKVLSDLGWGDGFRIPIANAENKRLEEEVEQKNRLRTSLKSQLQNTLKRIQEIRKHASDVRQEQSQNQRLLGAHSAQVETEKQSYLVVQAEESKLIHKTKQYERQVDDTSERIDGLQQTVTRVSKRLQTSKKGIQMSTNRLLDWEERLSKKEEKNIIIEQFVKSDEKTFKEKELERQNLSEKAELYRHSVVKIVGDTRELELALDRTAHLYSQGIKDRRQLMNQWSQTVNVLTQRDKSIFAALQEIDSLREIAKEKMDIYQEAERFLNIQETENKEIEYNMKNLERNLIQYRQERQKLLETIENFSMEVHVQQKLFQDLARRIEDARKNIKHKKNENEDKTLKLEDYNRMINGLKETLKNIDGQKMNTEERMLKLKDMLEKEEKRKADLLKAIQQQQSLILSATTRINNLEAECKVIRFLQQAEAKRREQLMVEYTKLEKTLREKRDYVYQMDIEIQKCEIRLQNILGQGKNREEIEIKHNRVKQLEQMQKDKTESLKSLQAQVCQVEHDVRKITTLITSSKNEVQRLKAKQQELVVSIEGGEKQLKLAQTKCEEKMVDENIMKLRLKEAEKVALKVDDKLYDLEKFACQMEAAMQGRRSEIKMQKESMNLQRRVVLNECTDLRNMITERRSRVNQLQARYDLAMAVLGANLEDGTPITAAYMMVLTDQERYLLQERGDRLDSEIRKAEKEIRSMENTLKLVNFCNDKYKSNLSVVNDNEPEKIEQRESNKKLFDILEILKQKRQKLKNAEEDYMRMETNCEKLEKDIEKIKEEKENKRKLVLSLELQVTEQKEKISRANKNLRKILKEIQNKCICTPDETILLQERDIAVRELQEQNNLALQRITEFTIRFLEAEAYVKKLLDTYNIDLPCTYYLKQPVTSMSSSRGESMATSRMTLSSSRSESITTFRSFKSSNKSESFATSRTEKSTGDSSIYQPRECSSFARDNAMVSTSYIRFDPNISDASSMKKSSAKATRKQLSKRK